VRDDFTYTITDADGDQSSAVQPITIGDDGPEIGFPGDDPGDPVADTGEAALDEDDLAAGGSDQSDAVSVTKAIAVDFGDDGPAASNALVLEIPPALTAAGLTSGGQPVSFALSADGLTITGSAGGEEVLSISLSGDPTAGYSYTATLSQPLDHGASGEDSIQNLPFTLVATDGDGTVARAGIEVDVVDDVPTATDEAALAVGEGASLTGYNVLSNDVLGADGATLTSFSYADANGAQQTAAAGSTVTTEYGQLTVNADGTWSYTANNGLNHGGGALEDGFTYTVTDADGDQATAMQAISITDGGPQVGFGTQPFGQPGGGSLDEDDLSFAQGDGEVGTDGSGASAFTQAINVDFGGDGPAASDAVQFEIPQALIDAGLTSDGDALGYSLSGDGLTLSGSAGGDVIFTATISGDPSAGYSYAFDLVGNLDHPAGAGENAITGIPLSVVVTDADGDQARGELGIEIVDDVPQAVDQLSVSTEEGGATIGSSNGGENLFANDVFGADADGASITGFTYTDVTGQEQTATPGTTVQTQYGTLTVQPWGGWSYTANDGLDHSGGQPLQDGFSYTIRDADGDESTAAQPIAITDDGPSVDVGGGLGAGGDQFSVDEDDLTAGSDGSDTTSVTGTLTIDGGSDGLASVALQVPQGLIDAGLTSGGDALSYSVSGDGQTLTATAGGETVFTVQLSETGGAYSATFTLAGQIDHPTAAGENAVTGLPFQVQVTDADGSTATAGFTVDVVDDVPQALNDATVSVEEGAAAVSGNVMSNDVEGADGATLTSFDYTDANGQTQTAAAGATVTTANGSLTVNADGSWSFTPHASVDNSQGAVADGFTYTITDEDGDQSSATQAIEITDSDGPNAVDDGPDAGDGGASVVEGTNTITGNVVANDDAGSDGPVTVQSFSYTDETGATQTASAGSTVDTQYGQLTVNADGSWT
ncbi:MAG: T1SS-143 repeat domain-containing protein, partial [Phycisphaerales bacterium]